jgi:hypothetical protein
MYKCCVFVANMAEVEELVVKTELPEIKMFGRWSTDDVQVSDISLTVNYVLMA